MVCKGERCYTQAGKKHTCTDCAAARVAEVRDHCQWDHSVLMVALTLKILQKERDDGTNQGT
jgi:hypothetical protein